MIITYTQLAALNACPKQLALFKRRYGEGGRVTRAKVLAGALDFDWGWAASSLLGEAQLTAYAAAVQQAEAAYAAAIQLAEAAYAAAIRPAEAAYAAATLLAGEAYLAAVQPAKEAYAAAVQQAEAAYAAAIQQAKEAYLAAVQPAKEAYAAAVQQAEAAYAGESALAFWQASRSGPPGSPTRWR